MTAPSDRPRRHQRRVVVALGQMIRSTGHSAEDVLVGISSKSDLKHLQRSLKEGTAPAEVELSLTQQAYFEAFPDEDFFGDKFPELSALRAAVITVPQEALKYQLGQILAWRAKDEYQTNPAIKANVLYCHSVLLFRLLMPDHSRGRQAVGGTNIEAVLNISEELMSVVNDKEVKSVSRTLILVANMNHAAYRWQRYVEQKREDVSEAINICRAGRRTCLAATKELPDFLDGPLDLAEYTAMLIALGAQRLSDESDLKIELDYAIRKLLARQVRGPANRVLLMLEKLEPRSLEVIQESGLFKQIVALTKNDTRGAIGRIPSLLAQEPQQSTNRDPAKENKR